MPARAHLHVSFFALSHPDRLHSLDVSTRGDLWNTRGFVAPLRRLISKSNAA